MTHNNNQTQNNSTIELNQNEVTISNLGYTLLAHTIFNEEDNSMSKWEKIKNNFLTMVYSF